MQSIQTFDQRLSTLMKKHRITISELTRRLNIRSNTTLSRVLHAQCSAQAAEHFFQILQAITPPVFDAAEYKELESALEVTRLGVSAYSANLEMWRLLGNEPTFSTPFPIESYGPACFTDTAQLRAFYKTVRSATIHIASSFTYPLFSEIRDLITELDPGENIEVHHYFTLEGDASQIIHAVRTAMSALCRPRYHGYKMTRPATLDREFLSQSHAVVQFQRADGSYGTHVIVFVANRCMLYENDEKCGIYDMFVRRITEQARWYAPIKDEYAAELQGDLLLATKRMFLKEKDRALYGIKPDIPLSAIPFEMVEALMKDTAEKSAMNGAMTAELMWIQMQRNRNIYEKKSPSHFIVQKSGLRRFAETGVFLNQPKGVRPFTPTERIAILGECLRRTKEMHYFKLHLAKGRLADLSELEILCLDRLGIQLSKPWCCLHMGPVITLSEFTTLYQEFYTGELLEKNVESGNVTHSFIQSLIDGLKENG